MGLHENILLLIALLAAAGCKPAQQVPDSSLKRIHETEDVHNAQVFIGGMLKAIGETLLTAGIEQSALKNMGINESNFSPQLLSVGYRNRGGWSTVHEYLQNLKKRAVQETAILVGALDAEKARSDTLDLMRYVWQDDKGNANFADFTDELSTLGHLFTQRLDSLVVYYGAKQAVIVCRRNSLGVYTFSVGDEGKLDPKSFSNLCAADNISLSYNRPPENPD